MSKIKIKPTTIYDKIRQKLSPVFEELIEGLQGLSDEDQLNLLQEAVNKVAKTNKPRYCLWVTDALDYSYFLNDVLCLSRKLHNGYLLNNGLLKKLDYSKLRNTISKIKNIKYDDLEYFKKFCDATAEIEKEDNLIFNTYLSNYTIDDYIPRLGETLKFLNHYINQNGIKDSDVLMKFLTSLTKNKNFERILNNLSIGLFSLSSNLNEDGLYSFKKLLPKDRIANFLACVDETKINPLIDALVDEADLYTLAKLCDYKKFSAHDLLNKLLAHSTKVDEFWNNGSINNNEVIEFRKRLDNADQLSLDENYLKGKSDEMVMRYRSDIAKSSPSYKKLKPRPTYISPLILVEDEDGNVRRL